MRKQAKLPFKQVKSEFEMEHNDCTVLALSTVTPLTYREAHKLLADAGRSFGRGFHLRRWLKHEPNLIPGVQFTVMYDWLTAPLISKIDLESGLESIRTRNLTVGQFMKSKPQGNYLVFVRQHVFTVIDGTIHDSFLPGSRRIVKKIYKVEAL